MLNLELLSLAWLLSFRNCITVPYTCRYEGQVINMVMSHELKYAVEVCRAVRAVFTSVQQHVLWISSFFASSTHA